MRIALVIGHYDAAGGGAERWTDRHARWLVAHGHEVHLYARRFRDPPPDAICHAVNSPMGWGFGSRLRFAEAVARQLEADRFDSVHDMGDGWCADLIMPHHGTRVGGFLHTGAMLAGPIRRLRALGRAILPRYREFAELERRQFDLSRDTRFIAVSRMVAGHMQQYFGVPPERIDVVYNGVDVDRFAPACVESRREARRQFGLTERERVLVLVAHNFRLKGVASAIRAVARLQRERVVLLVAGGDEPRCYRRLAQRLGCGAAVRFVGDQRDPRVCFHAADVAIHPTYYDPCSLVVLEALACGLPVVTTHQNGAAELMTAGVSGYALGDPADDAALADAVRQCFEQRAALSLAARAVAEQHTLERNAREICALYRRRCSGPAGPPNRTAPRYRFIASPTGGV